MSASHEAGITSGSDDATDGRIDPVPMTKSGSAPPASTLFCPFCGSAYRLQPPPPPGEHPFHCHHCDGRFRAEIARPLSPAAEKPSAVDGATPPRNGATAAEAVPTPPMDGAAATGAGEPPIIPTMTDFADAPIAAPPKAPAQRLWPWLLAMLFLVALLGLGIHQQAWSHSRLIETIRAWWAPQRSIGWRLSHGKPQWIARRGAPPLLAISLRLHNGVLFDRPPPPIIVTARSNDPAVEPVTTLAMLFHHPTLAQLQQPEWQPPDEDRAPVPAGGSRDYLIVLDRPPPSLADVEIALH